MGTREGPLTAEGPEGTTGTLRAALDWWALAGADTLVTALPQSWLDPATAPEPPDRALAEAPRPARAARAVTVDAEDFGRFTTLEEFRSHVRGRWPGAPLFDGEATGILVMGEAPSATDLETGRPFTGPAGKLLDRMLAAIGLDRGRCGITLVAPRRPAPGPPRAEEIAEDLPLTWAHLRLLAPRAILLLGATATRAMTGETAPISSLRGRPLMVAAGDIAVPALATFNPAYLLRRPEDKALAWADLLAFRALLTEKAPA